MGVRIPLPNDVTIDETTPLLVEHDGVPYGVFRVDGELRAFVMACSHKDRAIVPLRLRKGCIVCPHHGATFDPRTGEVVDPHGNDVPSGLEQVAIEQVATVAGDRETSDGGTSDRLALHARKRHRKRLSKKERKRVRKRIAKRAERAAEGRSEADRAHANGVPPP